MRRRLLVAVLGGIAGLLVVGVSLGLPSGPAGAADNGDGSRLYCGAGLTPATVDGASNWKGGVVLDFATGGPVCADPVVSSALPVLQLATTAAGPVWSLARLGLLYAVAVGAVTGTAGWAAGRRWPILLPALVPLAGITFSRFFVSTYSEPAGLLGMYAACLGGAVLAVTEHRQRAERAVGLVLLAGGGLLAGTAKTAYLPVLLVAVAVCAGVRLGRAGGWRDRVAGPAVAVAVLLLAAGPVAAAVEWQQRNHAVINAHNLVFTLVLPEVGAEALAPLGLPAAAASSAGRAYYPEGANGYPGSEVVAAAPGQVRSAANRVLLEHPGAVLAALGTGLAATLGAGLDYLPADPLGPGSVAAPLGRTVGEQGADRAQLLAWLDGLPVPWLPAAVVLAGVVAGVLLRGRGVVLAGLGRLAALSAVAAVGLVAVAVLGDGYFEIAKHVWPAAYLLAVTAGALVLAGGAALVGLRRPPSTPDARPAAATLRP